VAYRIDDVFSALADSNRRQILLMLTEHEMNVNSIASNFKVSRPAVSKHLKILERSKLVKPRRKGRNRYFELTVEPLNEVRGWLKFYEKFWDEKLNSLETYLQKQMKAEPFIIERTFDAPASKIWTAITEKNEMKLWYFDLAEFKPEVGFEFQFYGGTEKRRYLHLCKVTEVVAGEKLTYSWKYDGYPGESFVTFELFTQGDKTRVRLTHAGLETFPADEVPDLARKNFEQGWTEIIGTSLKEYLEKK
jgi:uncharacterized protein YndB with AHSA1/START domain/DNA-binding transcriptional ArsR family regulator